MIDKNRTRTPVGMLILFLVACGPAENLDGEACADTDAQQEPMEEAEPCIAPEDLGSYEDRCEEMCMEHVIPAVMAHVDGTVDNSCTEQAANDAYRSCYNGCILEIALDIAAVKDLCGE